MTRDQWEAFTLLHSKQWLKANYWIKMMSEPLNSVHFSRPIDLSEHGKCIILTKVEIGTKPYVRSKTNGAGILTVVCFKRYSAFILFCEGQPPRAFPEICFLKNVYCSAWVESLYADIQSPQVTKKMKHPVFPHCNTLFVFFHCNLSLAICS